MRSYPDDPWKAEENWPEGYAQLTRIGKQQHYLMGQYMRKRYSSLLGDGSYSPNLVYIRSTVINSVASNVFNLKRSDDFRMLIVL